MERMTWTERIANVGEKVREGRSLLDTMCRRKTHWLGHVIRSGGMMRTVIEGGAFSKKPRGRQRGMFLDDIKEKTQYSENNAIALDRDLWRRLTYIGPASGQITLERDTTANNLSAKITHVYARINPKTLTVF